MTIWPCSQYSKDVSCSWAAARKAVDTALRERSDFPGVEALAETAVPFAEVQRRISLEVTRQLPPSGQRENCWRANLQGTVFQTGGRLLRSAGLGPPICLRPSRWCASLLTSLLGNTRTQTFDVNCDDCGNGDDRCGWAISTTSTGDDCSGNGGECCGQPKIVFRFPPLGSRWANEPMGLPFQHDRQ